LGFGVGGFRVWGLGFRVWRLVSFRVQGLRLRVKSSKPRAKVLGFRV
jgi:hypothetical protein